MDEYKIVDNGYIITYYRNGKIHREDGPAVFWKEKTDEYLYLDPTKPYIIEYKVLTPQQKSSFDFNKKYTDLDRAVTI